MPEEPFEAIKSLAFSGIMMEKKLKIVKFSKRNLYSIITYIENAINGCHIDRNDNKKKGICDHSFTRNKKWNRTNNMK